MPDGTLEVEKQPMTGSVSRPSSGAYGEGVALTRLQDALPPMQKPSPADGPSLPAISTAPPMAPSPEREGRPPSGAALPPGVPSVLLSPTDQPGTPVHTPLASSTPAMQLSGQQLRLQILDALAESPNSSDETRQWAVIVRRTLLGG